MQQWSIAKIVGIHLAGNYFFKVNNVNIEIRFEEV